MLSWFFSSQWARHISLFHQLGVMTEYQYMYYGNSECTSLHLLLQCVLHFVPIRHLNITPLCVCGCHRRLPDNHHSVKAWLRLGGTAGGHLVQVPVAQEYVQEHVRESQSPAQYQFTMVWGTVLNYLPILPWFCVTAFRLKHMDSAKLLHSGILVGRERSSASWSGNSGFQFNSLPP